MIPAAKKKSNIHSHGVKQIISVSQSTWIRVNKNNFNINGFRCIRSIRLYIPFVYPHFVQGLLVYYRGAPTHTLFFIFFSPDLLSQHEDSLSAKVHGPLSADIRVVLAFASPCVCVCLFSTFVCRRRRFVPPCLVFFFCGFSRTSTSICYTGDEIILWAHFYCLVATFWFIFYFNGFWGRLYS